VPHSSQRARDRELLPRSICAVTYIPLSSGARLGSWIRHTSGTLVVCVSPISHSPNLGVELVTPLCYKCYLSNGGLGDSLGGRNAREQVRWAGYLHGQQTASSKSDLECVLLLELDGREGWVTKVMGTTRWNRTGKSAWVYLCLEMYLVEQTSIRLA
jgi:hypothetical protein